MSRKERKTSPPLQLSRGGHFFFQHGEKVCFHEKYYFYCTVCTVHAFNLTHHDDDPHEGHQCLGQPLHRPGVEPRPDVGGSPGGGGKGRAVGAEHRQDEEKSTGGGDNGSRRARPQQGRQAVVVSVAGEAWEKIRGKKESKGRSLMSTGSIRRGVKFLILCNRRGVRVVRVKKSKFWRFTAFLLTKQIIFLRGQYAK